MEQRIVLSLLKIVGVHNPTSEDFQRACKIMRVDKMPYKLKFMVWMALPMVTQYIEFLLEPEKVPVDND